MTSPTEYQLVLAPPARRAIADQLPESVAHAVIDFITGPLVENPHRVGKPLRGDLSGIWSARRGAYRVLYRILEPQHEVLVMRVGHRTDVYRT